MFYNELEEGLEYSTLRFGDVLKNFLTVLPIIDNPTTELSNLECKLKISHCLHALLTPCCSIEKSFILLAPLEKPRDEFFKNQYFKRDMTLLNAPLDAHSFYTKEKWEKLTDKQKDEEQNVGPEYRHLSLFIYDQTTTLPKYPVGDSEFSYYQIDFRKTFCVKCSQVINPKESPLKSKIIELSVQAREGLRKKLSKFYGRVPLEDEPFLLMNNP